MAKQIGKLITFVSFTFVGAFLFGSVLNAADSQTIGNECGSINIPKELPVHVKRKGLWPFSVSIYTTDGKKLFCGGTLISRRHVLTAARCVQNGTQLYTPDEIAVLLGGFYMLAESGVKQAKIAQIFINPGWDPISMKAFDSDIAILLLSDHITLSNDIQVVCLPSDGDVINDNATGFIVGWDYLLQQTPKHAMLNVYSNSHCYDETHLLSALTFCGGAADFPQLLKKVVGGGFFNTTGSAWVLHGVVVSVSNETDSLTNQTVVSLMNVGLVKNWIIDTVKQSGDLIGEAIRGTVNLECVFIHLYSSYSCVAHGLNVLEKNFGVDKLIGTHESEANNLKVELIQFHNGTMFYLVDGIGKLFPNLKSFFVGYSDADSESLNISLVRRSNFQNMKNLFEIAIHKSRIESIAEDLLWDLPNLERFQLDGMLLEIPERTFEKNAKLKEVYLASNGLVFLPKNLFKYNLELQWVNFENNSLRYIETEFIRLPNIRYIFLTGNFCINKNLNTSAVQQAEDQDLNEYLSENNDVYQVGRVVTLQRLIYSKCTYYNTQ